MRLPTTAEQCLEDLRLGCRIFTKSPGVSATAVALVALVIGGNTTVFSIAHGILAKPSPGVHARGLATVSWIDDRGGIETHAHYPVYEAFRERSTTFESLAAFDFQRVTLTHEHGSYAVRVGIVSPNYFETLGVRLIKGRSFTAEEGGQGPSGLTVVLAHHLWQNSFRGADDLSRIQVAVNGRAANVVGVVAPEFRGAWLAELADVWVPLVPQFRPWLQPNRSGVAVAMIGRRAPGSSLPAAQAELDTLWSQLQSGPDARRNVRARLVPYSATAGGNSIISARGYQMLAIFSIVTLLTIVIVCANVTNLLIARAIARQRELALRQSLGASRPRIVRALLAEGLVLSVAAWIAACAIAWVVSRVAVRILAPSTQTAIVTPDLSPDWTVVGYALALALLCTLAVTVGPAVQTWRQQLLPFLKVGEQGVVPARSRLARSLVVLQLAFSVLLLTIAGLAHRSLSLQDGLDVGFETKNVLLATVNTAGSVERPETNAKLLDTLQSRLARLPGVEGVSFVAGLRLSSWMDFPVRANRHAESVSAISNRVAPGFFAALGVPFIAGQDFAPAGQPGRRGVIVTRALADSLWPGESAIGRTLVAGQPDRAVESEVVGIVRDAYFGGRGNYSQPHYIFFASADRPGPPGEATFYIRHVGPADGVAPAVGRALREADARVAISTMRPLETQVAENVAPLRMLTTLITLFAGGSLLIAAIGQYAVVAFDGRRRTREFGLRIALGASSRQLMTAVIGESFRLTAFGLAFGFAMSAGVAAVLSRTIRGIAPTDALTYIGVFALLALASLLACYLPARRATRVDPMVALRTE